MQPGWRKSIPAEALLHLRQRLSPKSPERASQVAEMSELYGLSTTSVYRAFNDLLKPHAVHWLDHGQSRILLRQDMERYCELVAALKFRITNRKGRHLPTRRAIELLENYDADTEQGHIQAPKSIPWNMTGSSGLFSTG
ncbi:hypothetical protein C6H68_22385 [Photorhabdus luminescens]|nr:hypothetical protein C6H68_22385 [Photorhabdus luminescens]